MGRAVSIPPLNMTPEELAKALLRPINQSQENSENAGRPKAGQQIILEQTKDDPEFQIRTRTKEEQ